MIVNDGSLPEGEALLHDIARQKGVRVIDQPNAGQGAARNAGVAATTCEYICFLDQDDIYLPDHIERLRSAVPAGDDRFGWVYGDASVADEAGVIKSETFVADRGAHPKVLLKRMLSEDMYVLPSASLISRRAFEDVGGFDPQFMGYEDDDMFLRIFQRGYSNVFVDAPVLIWCIHHGSTSYSFLMTRSRIRYLLKLSAAFPDQPEAGEFPMRDCLVPRFSSRIIKDARRAHKPAHKLYANRDEIYGLTRTALDAILANPWITPKQRRSVRWGWAMIRLRRYGVLGMLEGRND